MVDGPGIGRNATSNFGNNVGLNNSKTYKYRTQINPIIIMNKNEQFEFSEKSNIGIEYFNPKVKSKD